MTDLEYLTLAEEVLNQIELNCDFINETTDADIDAQRNGGVVTLIFQNQSQIIVNLQKPLHEIWLAAKAGGFHYKYQNGAWHNTKTHSEFYTDLTTFASEQAGLELKFAANK